MLADQQIKNPGRAKDSQEQNKYNLSEDFHKAGKTFKSSRRESYLFSSNSTKMNFKNVPGASRTYFPQIQQK